MIKSLVASALFAGFAAGLFSAALQFVFVETTLLEAEQYESGAKVHFAAPPEAGHDHDSPAPAETAASADAVAEPFDLRRHALTVLSMVLRDVGYAMILLAGFALAEMQGVRVSARAGMIWGLAGFIAIQFAPAFGLAPELPGMAAADLAGRQFWWAGTAVCTAGALWMIAFGKTWVPWAAAVALLFLPHLIGAPQVVEMNGAVPPELAAEFVGRVLGVGLAGWVLLGTVGAAIWDRSRA